MPYYDPSQESKYAEPNQLDRDAGEVKSGEVEAVVKCYCMVLSVEMV